MIDLTPRHKIPPALGSLRGDAYNRIQSCFSKYFLLTQPDLPS